jgi:hypothetical protein
MNEALDALEKKILARAPVYLAHAIVDDDAEAIHWIDGQGLYAVVTVVTDPFHGSKCKAAVGGALYGSWGGRFHSEPLRRGEHVLVAMVEGGPDGHAVVLSRVAVQKSAPPSNAVFRLVSEQNLEHITFDVLADGESWYTGVTNGAIFTRLEGDANYTVQFPDGGVIDATKDEAQGGYAIKLKTGSGATVLATSKGVSLKSPNGKNYLEVTDAGIVLHGKVVKTEGLTMLNVKPVDAPPMRAVAYGGPPNPIPTSPAPPIAFSAGVFVGAGV